MKKTFAKKALSVCLAVIMLVSSASALFIAFAESDSVKFAVATDIHVETGKTELEVKYPENELYFHASGTGNMYDQAADLTNQFLYSSAESGAEFILITGDLTRHGNEEEHNAVASLLADFENETGIQVYIVPGNHDYYSGVSRDFIRTCYADFGYNTALASDAATASYTADICDGYRLIAVDSNDPGNDGDAMTEELLGWIEEQTEKANSEGKKVIYMMHHPLLEHLYLGRILMKDFILKDSKAVAEKFTQWGIQYVFTGHEHGNDVASFTGKNGKVVYDVLTTSLSSYPLEYRDVVMTDDGADIKIHKIEECNLDALIDGYTDAQKALLESDYEEFAYGLFKYAIEKKILGYVAPDSIKRALKLESGPLADTVENLFTAICDALTMPIYDNGENVSIEKLANSKGVKIPESEYGSLIELASAMVAMHYHGDENMAAETSPECEIIIKGLNTGLQYVLTRTGREGLNTLLDIIGLQVNTDELSPLFTAVSLGKENSYEIAEKVLYPILNKFAVDSDLPDRDVYLPASPEAEQSQSLGFFERIIAFFTGIFDFISKLFNI